MTALWDDAEAPPPGAIPDGAAEVEALLVPNSSRRCQQRLACLLAGLVAGARRDVYLTPPYFCPGTIIGDAIRTAAARGVDVRLLVPRLSDPPITGWATRAVPTSARPSVRSTSDLLDADEIQPSAWRARGWSERGLEMVGRTLRKFL